MVMSLSSRIFCFPEEVESEYCLHDRADSVRSVRAVAFLILGLYTLFGVTGQLLYEVADPLAFKIYFAHLIPGTILWIALTYTEWAKKNIHLLTIIALYSIVIPGHLRFNLCLSTRAALFEPAATITLSFLMAIGLRLSVLKAAWITGSFFIVVLMVHTYTGGMELYSGGLGQFKLRVAPFYMFAAYAIGIAATYLLEAARRRSYLQQREIEAERAKSEALLLNVLPASIAERLKSGEENIIDRCERATVLFADIVGYTRLAGSVEPEKLLEMLETIFMRFDGIMTAVGMEKIKTIGDAYMAVAGLPEACDDPDARAAQAAVLMRSELETINKDLGLSLTIRVGIHSGPVMAGVIGRKKFSYDLWGDAVNLASRLESHGLPGRIQISADVAEVLDGKFRCIPRGPIEIKGKGTHETYWLEPSAAFSPVTTSTAVTA